MGSSASFSYDTAGTVTISTQELHAGQWKFALVATDKKCNQSSYSILNLLIKADGTRVSTTPLAPVNLYAYPTANAGAVLIWDHAGSDTSAFKLYHGGTLDKTVSSGLTVTPHYATINGLTDGTQYTFHVLAYNGGVASASSNAATATMDATAPDGAKALTIELI